MIKLTKKTDNNDGCLYKINYNNDTAISLSIDNTISLFGLETYKNNFYIKWIIDNNFQVIDFIESLENNIKSELNTEILSNLIKKEKYPLMLNTKIIYTKNINIINSDKGGISTIKEYIKKGNKYNMSLSISDVFLNKKKKLIFYSIIIKKIEIAL